MTELDETWAELVAAVRALPIGARVGILVGTAGLGLAVALMAPAERQQDTYHAFAPSGLFNVENTGIVASNAAFLIVGIWGLRLVWGGKSIRRLFTSPGDGWPYAAFFAGVMLIALGSGYYHADPSTKTLVWDRLAMAIVFMALLAAFIADRIDRAVGVAVMLPALLAVAAASMVYWRLTGDLRLYRIVEVFPIALIPMMCLLFAGRLTRLKYALWMGFWFALATAFEQFDWDIYRWISVGGHTIKHLAAALACAMVVAMLRDAARRRGATRPGETGPSPPMPPFPPGA